MKKHLIIFLVFLNILFSCNVSIAQEDVKIELEGTLLHFAEDSKPRIVNGRTLIPLRSVLEQLGATVIYKPNTQTIMITMDDVLILMQLGSNIIYYSDLYDETEITLDVPAQLIGERTFIPFRAVFEVLGYEVKWDDNSKTVIVS